MSPYKVSWGLSQKRKNLEIASIVFDSAKATAAESLLAYLLAATKADPIHHEMLFEAVRIGYKRMLCTDELAMDSMTLAELSESVDRSLLMLEQQRDLLKGLANDLNAMDIS